MKSSLVLCSLAVTGCVATEATTIEVRLEEAQQSFKDLPIVASGKTSLLGQDVPDSHGEIAMTVHITGATHVKMSNLQFTVDLDGEPLDIEIQRVRIDGQDAATIGSSLVGDGQRLTVDFRAKGLDNLVQPAGADFTSHAAMTWQENDIGALETDIARLDVSGLVAAAVNTGSFALVDGRPQEAMAPGATSTQLRASAEITNGLTVSLQSAKLTATYFGGGTVPALGFAVVNVAARQIGSTHATTVAPGAMLDVFTSTRPTASPAPYEAAGTAATTGDVGGGKALVLIELDYTPNGMPPAKDVLAYVVDVP